MKLEIKRVSIASLVVSSLPLVVFVMAALGGAVTFMIMPAPQFSPMSLPHKLFAVGLYSLLYAVLVSALLVFVSFIYNIFTGVLGLKGVVFEFEEMHSHE